jgi:single-strand DNA-binding protein
MINRVVLMGNLTRDPELKKTTTGLSVISFSLAVNRRTNGQEEVDFFDCEAWRQSADYLGQYAKKGNTVAVEGRLKTDSYEKDGVKVKKVKIVCDNVTLVRTTTTNQTQGNYQPAPQNQAPKAATGYFPDEAQVNDDDFNTGPLLDISSDDLPF